MERAQPWGEGGDAGPPRASASWRWGWRKPPRSATRNEKTPQLCVPSGVLQSPFPMFDVPRSSVCRTRTPVLTSERPAPTPLAPGLCCQPGIQRPLPGVRQRLRSAPTGPTEPASAIAGGGGGQPGARRAVSPARLLPSRPTVYLSPAPTVLLLCTHIARTLSIFPCWKIRISDVETGITFALIK